MSALISKICELVHPEVQNDLYNFYLTAYDGGKNNQLQQPKCIFSNKLYKAHLQLDPFMNYRSLSNPRVQIYSGGLGFGNYIGIFFDVETNKYTFEGTVDFNDYNNILKETSDWVELKEHIDNYFYTLNEKFIPEKNDM